MTVATSCTGHGRLVSSFPAPAILACLNVNIDIIHVNMHTHTCTHIYAHTRKCIHAYTHMHVYMYTCVYASIYICINVSMYISINVNIDIYILYARTFHDLCVPTSTRTKSVCFNRCSACEFVCTCRLNTHPSGFTHN